MPATMARMRVGLERESGPKTHFPREKEEHFGDLWFGWFGLVWFRVQGSRFFFKQKPLVPRWGELSGSLYLLY